MVAVWNGKIRAQRGFFISLGITFSPGVKRKSRNYSSCLLRIVFALAHYVAFTHLRLLFVLKSTSIVLAYILRMEVFVVADEIGEF